MKKINKYLVDCTLFCLCVWFTCFFTTCRTNKGDHVLRQKCIKINQRENFVIEAPVKIENFVGGSEVAFVQFYSTNDVRITTKQGKAIKLKSHMLKGVPSELTNEQLNNFLTKNAWLAISRDTSGDYLVSAHLRSMGGMKNTTVALDVWHETLTKLANKFDIVINVKKVNDNQGTEKIFGTEVPNKKKIFLEYDGKLFHNRLDNGISINYGKFSFIKDDPLMSLAFAYCINKEYQKYVESGNKGSDFSFAKVFSQFLKDQAEKLKKDLDKEVTEGMVSKKGKKAILLDIGFEPKKGNKPILSSSKRSQNKKKVGKSHKSQQVKKLDRKDYPNVKSEHFGMLDLYLQVINSLNQAGAYKVSSFKKTELYKNINKIITGNQAGDFYKLIYSRYPQLGAEYEKHKNYKDFCAFQNAKLTHLEKMAKEYFGNLKKDDGIQYSFKPKETGIQSGKVMYIEYQDGKKEKYYIKTHQHGTKSNRDGSTQKSSQPVDPKELFVYKVLESIKLGPSVHFFGDFNISGNCYIATKDVNDQGEFFTYEKLNKKNVQQEEITKGLIVADIFSRIFNIKDVIQNKSNFGFVVVDGKSTIQIIDFQVPESYTIDSYKIEGIYQGYIKGNGSYNYNLGDPYINYAFQDITKDKKLDITNDILKNELCNLSSAIANSYVSVNEFIDRNNMTLHKEAKKSYDRYYNDIISNLKKIKDGLSKEKKN